MKIGPLLFTVLAFCGSNAFGQNKAGVERNLNAKYKAVTTAFSAHQIGPISDLLAADYRAIGPNGGSITKAQVLADLGRQMHTLTSVQWPRTVRSLTLNSLGAVAIVTGHLTAKTVTRPPHRLDMVASTRDVWLKTVAGWKLHESKLLSSKMTMDGKPLRRS